MSLTTRRSLGLLGALAILVAACGTAATPAPSAPPASGAPSTAPATEAPTAAVAEQTLVYAIDGEISGGLGNAADNVPTAYAQYWLHAQLYVYDYSLTPVPYLAAKLADISPDGKEWTLTLRDGLTFTDGSPLTADDVVQSWEIARSANCPYNPSVCVASVVTSIEKIDAKTVKFTLKEPLATFATIYLPGINIESKAAVDASYAKYKASTSKVTAEEVKAVMDKIKALVATGTEDEPADMSPLTADMEALLNKAGLELPKKSAYTGSDGTFNAGGYANDLVGRVKALDAQFTAPAIDAMASAYRYLDFQQKPVGAGPFKLTEFKPGESLTFERYDGFFAGKPQISKIFVPIIKDDIAGGQALKAGQIDWKYSLEGTTYLEIKDAPNLKFADYPDFGFFTLYFNQVPGTLYAGEAAKPLRQAWAWCFDKEATVTAATSGQATAIYSDIPPASWAFPKDLPTYQPRDVAKGKALIEGAGWKLGSDGIYEKDGVKLSSIIAVRAERAERSKYIQLVSDQLKDCGIDLKFKEIDFAAIMNMLNVYPHINAADPASGKPFDVYFGGFDSGYDPDPFALYHSSQCADAKNPTFYNFICFQNATVDKLIEDGLHEFDQAKRAAIYQEYAKVMADELPVLYAWADIRRQGLAATVNLVDGTLPLNTPTIVTYQQEKITNIK